MISMGIPLTSEHDRTAALQRHFLKESSQRTMLMRERLGKARGGEGSAGIERPNKTVWLRVFSKKPQIFWGRVGEGANTQGTGGRSNASPGKGG